MLVSIVMRVIPVFQNLQPFVSDLQEASGLLLRTIGRLEGVQRIGTVQVGHSYTGGCNTLMLFFRN